MGNIKIHFVGNFTSKDNLQELQSLEWEDGTIACTRHTWVWPLYCQLKMRGFPVSLSYRLESDAINIIHGPIARQLLQVSDLKKCFIIGIRADFPPFPFGQFEIVQNRNSEGGRRVYMPLFSQPGLMVRDPSRGKAVNVCFSGRMQNSGLDPDEFAKDLLKIGCQFHYKGEGQWQEMQDVDILIGIRSLSKKAHHSKPPSKLFNAWLAGIPFIGGYDSAYEQVGMPDENYLRVSSYGELLESINRLKNDADLYQSLVVAGKEAGEGYTPDKITDMWLEFFENKAIPRYQEWASGGRKIRWRSSVNSLRFYCSIKQRKIIELLRGAGTK